MLAHSLRDNGTRVPLVILVTTDVPAHAIDKLKVRGERAETRRSAEHVQELYDQIIPVDRIVNKTPANLYLMGRADLESTFTKIALWRQTQYDHLVYIDADVVALRAPDELFDLEAPFAAVPDIGWPDCFNSGVMSLKPNMGDYYALLALAQRGISFDGADQGLLNTHFRSWHRLSFTYNCTPSGNYQYLPAYRHFQSTISLVHFIGRVKPWMGDRTAKVGSRIYEELLGRWWSVYDRHYRVPSYSDAVRPKDPRFGPSTQTPSHVAKQLAQHPVGGQRTEAKPPSADDRPPSPDTSVGEQRNQETSANSAEGPPNEPAEGPPNEPTKQPLNEQSDPAAYMQPAEPSPSRAIQQPDFSVEWDPRRYATVRSKLKTED